MKKNTIVWGCIFAVGCILLIGSGCKSNSPAQPPTPKPLALLQPRGGEQYHVGQQVPIKWTIDDSLANHYGGLSSVRVELLHDTALTASHDSTIVQTLGNGSFSASPPPPDTSYLWTVDSAHAFASCRIKIVSYTDPGSFPSDSSGLFSSK